LAGRRRRDDGCRRAFEIEFAPKGTARLRGIVGAYERSRYTEAQFLVKDAALGRRIASLVGGPSSLQQMLELRHCTVSVVPWIGLTSEQQRLLAAQLGR
jgi:hypothetical protein